VQTLPWLTIPFSWLTSRAYSRTVPRTASSRSPRERPGLRTGEKFAARRVELAAAAMQTLAELGYARTSLREIAERTDFSHGLLHYYFADKDDLIYECVRLYKADCIARHDAMVDRAHSALEVRSAFADYLATTVRQDGRMHRLWYDLRNQSMFEPALREAVREIDESLESMVWRVLSRYAEATGQAPVVEREFAYRLFDGLFQHALMRYLHGEEDAPKELSLQIEAMIDQLFPPTQRLAC
jgi:AcrR family transcriptional regulator